MAKPVGTSTVAPGADDHRVIDGGTDIHAGGAFGGIGGKWMSREEGESRVMWIFRGSSARLGGSGSEWETYA